jgi:PPM family protein phosphatase
MAPMNPSPSTNPLESTWPEAEAQKEEPLFEVRPLVTRVFGRSDVGREREANEDRFLIAAPVSTLWNKAEKRGREAPFADIEGELFVVADGMGGHAGGAHASALAVEAVETSLISTLSWLFALGDLRGTDIDVLEQMNAALRSADARVCEAAARTPAHREMGTTLTMAYRFGGWLFVAHAGDSRCYVLRRGVLHRITHDHTLVSDLVRQGMMGSEEAEHHELRHLVTNAIGGAGAGAGVRSEGHRVRIQADDVVLLCTDGLTEMVTDLEIRLVLEGFRDPKSACDRLVAAANDHGGLDNITAIVARFEKPGAAHLN